MTTLAAPWASKILNGAASQKDRIGAAPQPGRVLVDGRTVPQLLAFAVRYGALIQFYDLEDRPMGDWLVFFAADPAVSEALHAALDLREIEQTLRSVLAEARDAGEGRRQAHVLRRAIDVIALLLCILDRSPPGGEGSEILLRPFPHADRCEGVAEALSRLRHHNGRRTEHPEEADRAWRDLQVDLLEDVAGALIAELARGLDGARAAVDASLNQPGHAPQAAVWNAFVRLFDEARGELNRFPSRLLNYYYVEILKQDSRAAEPSRVYLTFTLAAGATQAAIAKGTRFSAGVDAQGQPIYFAATSALEVTAAAVDGLKVHRVTYRPGGDKSSLMPTGVLSGIVDLFPADGSVPAPFPLFGADTPGSFGELTMSQASVGFVVATPTLLLGGGDRTVTISVISTLSQAGAAALAKASAAGATADLTASALTQILGPAFSLNYSTAGGWMTVPNATITPVAPESDDGPFTVAFSFNLPPDAPPLAPVSAKPAPGAPPPSLPISAFPQSGSQPTVIAQLQWEQLEAANAETPAPISLYALLSKIEIEDIEVSVAVTGLPPLALTNSSGSIDASQDFPVFGLAPAQGAALDITAPELFAKPLDSLSLAIDWAGLPVTTTGFAGYYQGYVLDADGVPQSSLFDNTTFRAAVSLVSPGLWSLDSTSQLYLFQTADSSTSADGGGPAAEAPVQGTSLLAATQVVQQVAPPYYNPASSKLRLTLTEPKYAFGNILYASNLMNASATTVTRLKGGDSVGTGSSGSSAQAPIANAVAVNANASEGAYGKSVSAAVSQAVVALNGEALASLRRAVADSQATPAAKSEWRQSLKTVANDLDDPSTDSLGAWLKAVLGGDKGASATGKLRAWASAHEADLLKWGGEAVKLAGDILTAAEGLTGALKATSGQSAAWARPTVAAALKQAQAMDALSTAVTGPLVSMPNPPWQPMASAVTLNYSASVLMPATAASSTSQADGPAPVLALHDRIEAGTTTPPDAHAFLHLWPFDVVVDAVPAQDAAPVTPAPAAPAPVGAGARPQSDPAATPRPRTAFMLPQVSESAALYIELSAPTDQISLLFIMTAGPDGWSTGVSDVQWEKQVGTEWLPVAAKLGDTTNGLRNTGIVTLQLSRTPDEDAPGLASRTFAYKDGQSVQNLRAVQRGGGDRSAYLVSVVANALSATWVGPGGAAELSVPLPAGTITQSVDPITGVGTVSQPMDSDGGSPPAKGRSFDLWMAERLRHKGFGIDAWDYSRLVLAAFPTLWQLAVVPATDERTGVEAPGHVWLVAVAGPKTPNIADPTVPMVDPAVLTDVGEMVQALVSPFVKLSVTNPPYLRLTVTATLIFSDEDTPAFWIAKLQDELIRFLSPWPDDTLGQRPPDYYTSHAVAEFIRDRIYVRGVTRLRLRADGDPGQGGWRYFTSAASHSLHADASAPARRRVKPRPRRTPFAEGVS
jgi:hypothetical protein